MKTALLQSEEKLHLTVVKNNSNNVKKINTPLFINTLIPNFVYQNSKGKSISPENHVLF